MTPQLDSKTPKIGAPATAVLSGSALSGAMMCISAVMIPVLLDTDTEPAALCRHWARLYHYGHIYMPGVCVGTVSLYGYTALTKLKTNRKQRLLYTAAAATTITMVPYTWVLMTSTNNHLFRLELLTSTAATASAVDLTRVKELVVKWMWLNIFRTMFPLVGAIIGLVCVLQEVGL